jgi:hypothetical protein
MKYNGLLVLFILSMIGCAGPAGPIGAQGDQGNTGPTGASGAGGMAVIENLHCAKTDTTVIPNLYYQYQVIALSGGDAFVTCSVAGANFQYSQTEIYSSTQVGATTGSCLVVDDIDNDGNQGYWDFAVANSPASASVTYKDPGSSDNNHSYTFVSTDCTLNNS